MSEVMIDPSKNFIRDDKFIRERIKRVAEKAVSGVIGEVSQRPDHAALMSAAMCAVFVCRDVSHNVLEFYAEQAVREYIEIWRKLVEMFESELAYERAREMATYNQVRSMAKWAHNLVKANSNNPWYRIVNLDLD